MKTLYLLRHAKAEAGSKILADKERPLSARGQQACEIIGNYIKTKHYLPELALCSPAMRTRETLQQVMRHADGAWSVAYEDRLYLAEAEETLKMIGAQDDSIANLMVVGHNPGMHHLALLLAAADGGRLHDTLELKYPTAALTVLRFDIDAWDEVRAGGGMLMDFITPDEL